MNYKHKQTGDIAVENLDAEQRDKTMCKYLVYGLPMKAQHIENTSDWELIPEAKMEGIEGCNVKDLMMLSKEGKWIHLSDDDIYILSPTPEARAIIKAVKEGNIYSRYVSKGMMKGLRSGDSEISGKYLLKNKEPDFGNLIFIIPETKGGEE